MREKESIVDVLNSFVVFFIDGNQERHAGPPDGALHVEPMTAEQLAHSFLEGDYLELNDLV